MPTPVKLNGISSTYRIGMDHPFERIIVESEVIPDADSVDWINPNIVSNESQLITGVPGKTGIVWTLDAATGEFLWAKETSYQNVIVGMDIENHKGITNENLEITEIRQRRFVCPSTTGGINWNSVGYSPETNALYVPSNNVCMDYYLNPVDPVWWLSQFRDPEKLPPEDFDGQVGMVSAIDVATGEESGPIGSVLVLPIRC